MDKTHHELFMEAAAVETAAMIWWEQYRQGDLPNRRFWSWCAPSQRDYARECARIEIEGQLRRRPPVIAAIEAAKAENMETRHDG